MTMRYVHLSPNVTLEIAGLLDRAGSNGNIECSRLPTRCHELAVQWRRRELNPSPRGIRLNLVHVRSRINPSGGVPEFGQDLASENLSHRAGSIAVTQP